MSDVCWTRNNVYFSLFVADANAASATVPMNVADKTASVAHKYMPTHTHMQQQDIQQQD